MNKQLERLQDDIQREVELTKLQLRNTLANIQGTLTREMIQEFESVRKARSPEQLQILQLEDDQRLKQVGQK